MDRFFGGPNGIGDKTEVDECSFVTIAFLDDCCSGRIRNHGDLEALLQEFAHVRLGAEIDRHAAKDDLVLQLRKRGIDKVILGGMSANLCTESHMRELLEQGFEVAVVSDATAAAQVAEGDGYQAALVNFRFIANTVWTTEQAVENMQIK